MLFIVILLKEIFNIDIFASLTNTTLTVVKSLLLFTTDWQRADNERVNLFVVLSRFQLFDETQHNL